MKASELTNCILEHLDKHGDIPDTRQFAPDIPSQTVKGALDSLAGREMIEYKSHAIETFSLSKEGEENANNHSPEYRLWEEVGEEGSDKPTLQAKLGDAYQNAERNALKNKFVHYDGQLFRRKVAQLKDETKEELLIIRSQGSHPDEKVMKDLRKRRLVTTVKAMYFFVSKGPKFSTRVAKLETDLTEELLQSGDWKNSEFKQYNFKAEGAPPASGALHPLLKVREEIRNIFFEMGFQEMATDTFVESGFWNFDTLFVPQQHPARELQDTFFLKDPSRATMFPEKYLEKVAKVHGPGDYGSTGYRYDWKRSETEKLVLRTHTTAVSAAMLYKIAQDPEGFKPSKLFSIDRVFRNEAVDATHLAEFHQVEGVVLDYNITLGDLIGFMEVFFSKMGVYNLKFKPAYNPYTEPSLEIFSWHEGLKKYVEIGNSGVFRPEMLQPMGFPKNVRALGWGLSLERPTMIRYGLSNIRDLVGHKIPIEFIEQSPAVRF